ncbi:MAG: transcription termination/antitermination protein NusA [Acidobacteriaceae bacterium]|nr:transcription termination/antitermination protein NusA [Acidobacteriaceae bacterium]MBV8572900.1 transcription termination/antitermination protein NusA [Acidobacteriaceae bacterium]
MASIYQSIEILSKEKGIDPQIVLDAVKDAMLAAARKHFRSTEDLVADLDETTGNIQIYSLKQVVEAVEDPVKQISLSAARKLDQEAEIGNEIRIAKPTEALGRISAQTAKQVILQKVREAERDTVFSEFQGRQGELVNCVIKRLEGQDYIADMGKTEARLPKKEQSRIENFSVGDRVRCVIKGVERGGKNSGVIVSRAAPELVMRLFEQEVPEIYDNTVAIKACAREAGERTKIAVASRDRDVDSVGACVGMKGMRVQSIIRELRGEKIDIIEYSDDPVQYATKALSPAKISRVTIIDAGEKHMEVVVDDLQLSLAIGKRGQNVRLAAKLIGWKIDIKSEEEKRRELEARMPDMVISGAPVSVLIDYALDEGIVEQLVGAGIGTVERLGSMTPEELESIPGIDENTVEQIQAAVVAYYNQYDAEQAGSPEDERAPADAESIEEAIDESTLRDQMEGNGDLETTTAFESIETGVLERDIATHEAALLEESDEGEVLDLGRVEGLSGAPSALRNFVQSENIREDDQSDTIEKSGHE